MDTNDEIEGLFQQLSDKLSTLIAQSERNVWLVMTKAMLDSARLEYSKYKEKSQAKDEL